MALRKRRLACSVSLWLCLGLSLPAAGCAHSSTPKATGETGPQIDSEAAKKAVHPVIEAYIDAFGDLLEPEELAELRAMDLSGTMVGDTQRLRYLAADKAVRIFLPAALDATGDPGLAEHARKVRRLPPVLNSDTDAVAYSVVAEALRAKRRYELLTAAGVHVENIGAARPVSAAEHARGMERLENGETTLGALRDDVVVSSTREASDREEYAEALAEYAEAYSRTYGVTPLQADVAAAAAADAADAATLLDMAIRSGASREELIGGGFTLIQEMATAARRRERIPTPKIPPKDKNEEDRPHR